MSRVPLGGGGGGGEWNPPPLLYSFVCKSKAMKLGTRVVMDKISDPVVFWPQSRHVQHCSKKLDGLFRASHGVFINMYQV